MSGYFYILAHDRHGVLYCGVTNDLIRRVTEHKKDEGGAFTKKYKVHKLAYYEATEDISDAIYREKCVKEWKRQWKVDLIEKLNPDWVDLYNDILQQ